MLTTHGVCACVEQIDGSLCGYFNKAFSQRPSVSESFQVWNARQTKRHGVLIDFGEFQSTYSNGGLRLCSLYSLARTHLSWHSDDAMAALCGFDDLLQGSRTTQRTRAPLEQLYRRKGIVRALCRCRVHQSHTTQSTLTRVLV